ncbi:hypothetical protein [Leptospira chreensis]|uniref:hypothetical protein n=1 Tax=Leptospira chreensis TaxID=2810035 RepID=UPI001E431196|nr:hypothetical protein [Leptospira chreensis]
MKQHINIDKKFFVLLILLTTLTQYNNCKIKLNNPKDPTSQSYMETWLWEEYLRSLCNPDLKTSVRLGTGTYKTYPYKLVKLKNGNFAVTAGVFEEVNWNGKTAGKNFSFSGTPGSDMNVILFLVNGKTLQIEWLDYIGELYAASDKKEVAPITELSNGDIVVAAYVKNSQGSPISPKSNVNALLLARFNSNGNRVWNTYLDKSDNSIVESRFSLVTDALDNLHLFFNGRGAGSPAPDTNGFSEFPAMEVSSNGNNTSHEEIGWAVISHQGVPIKQRYLPSNGSISILNAVIGQDQSILLFGGADDNFTGSTGHPLPSYNYRRPMVTKLSLSGFSISNITYLGSISPSYTIGTIYGITPGSDGIYTTGVSAGDFGTSIHPFQNYSGSTNFRNNIFSKFDWNGNLLWNQFLGSTTTDTLEISPVITYIPETNSVKAHLYSPENGSLYTGLTITPVRNGTNPLQKTTVNIAGFNGQYQSIDYETSFVNYPPAADEPMADTISFAQACGGRLVRLKNVFDISTEKGVLELSTRPAPEEP